MFLGVLCEFHFGCTQGVMMGKLNKSKDASILLRKETKGDHCLKHDTNDVSYDH